MANSYAKNFNPTVTLQTEPMPGTPQVANNAGGFVFTLDKWKRLERFLILGSDAPTYYQNARALTRENGQVVMECFDEDHDRTAALIRLISTEGRAPKNSPAIFALALGAVHPKDEARRAALDSLNAVCRTASHLFEFVETARQLGRGGGRAFKRAIAGWYAAKDTDQLAYQAVKYRQRNSYTHKRLIEIAHKGPGKKDPARAALYCWMRGKPLEDSATMPAVLSAHIVAMRPNADLPALVAMFELPWEALPTEALRNPAVWQAMLPHLGLTALIRNLGNMTEIGAIGPMDCAGVVARLGNAEDLRKSRVHPFTILQALSVYRLGHGMRGGKTWTPIAPVIDALDKAFYASFANVRPTNARILLGLDVSGSMDSPMGDSITCREVVAALSLVTAATEPNTVTMGFTKGFVPLPISPRQRLDDVARLMRGLPHESTDCSQPMLYALEKGLKIDAFVVYTDNETWAGRMHPVEALRLYRKQTGIAAKLIVVGMTSTGFSIADPNDAGMLDLVGFDSSGPALIAEFIRD